MPKMAEPRENVYTCPKCHGFTVTVDIDEGVTPMFLKCRASGREGDCDGMAVSAMYPKGPRPSRIPPPIMAEQKAPHEPECSFCGNKQHEVERLIPARQGFICNECIEVCNEAVRTAAPAAPSIFPPMVSTVPASTKDVVLGPAAPMCVKCGHGYFANPNGCLHRMKDNQLCGCKCEFPPSETLREAAERALTIIGYMIRKRCFSPGGEQEGNEEHVLSVETQLRRALAASNSTRGDEGCRMNY